LLCASAALRETVFFLRTSRLDVSLANANSALRH